MNQVTNFEYEGHKTSFEFADGNKMINATEMAKPFGKQVGGFLRSKSAKAYIEILEKRYANLHIAPKKEVLRVVKGGDASEGLQGTWMDQKLALRFAAWLSPEFDVWVFDRIEELLLTGKTSLDSDYQPSVSLQTLRMLIDQLEKQEMQAQRIKKELHQHENRIDDNSINIHDNTIQIKKLEAQIISIDENYFSISGYCSLNSIPCPLEKAKNWGKKATVLSHSKKYPVGQAYDAKYGNVNTYHVDILKQIIK